jgi:hypothetical protein
MMHGTTLPAVIVTTIAAFLFSSVWYVVFGKARLKLLGNDENATADMRKVPASQKLFELFRSFVVVLVVAHLLAATGASGWLDAVRLGVWLGVFPVMILVGASLWDKRPWKLSAIHGGDWLLKILIVAALLGAWR